MQHLDNAFVVQQMNCDIHSAKTLRFQTGTASSKMFLLQHGKFSKMTFWSGNLERFPFQIIYFERVGRHVAWLKNKVQGNHIVFPSARFV